MPFKVGLERKIQHLRLIYGLASDSLDMMASLHIQRVYTLLHLILNSLFRLLKVVDVVFFLAILGHGEANAFR